MDRKWKRVFQNRLIEARSVRFALTGSSARRLKREGTNLLAGRALTRFILRAFRADYPVACCLLLYGGDRTLREDGIDVWPVDEGVRRLPEWLRDPT